MVNQVVIVGNLGNKPEIRVSQGGTKVAKLSVATSYRDKTQWHRVTAFNGAADFAEQYLDKGDAVAVVGRIEYSTSEKDGVTRYWTDIIANRLQGIGKKSAEDEPTASGQDIPF